jgi:purine-binding chemotaxis protein CheW
VIPVVDIRKKFDLPIAEENEENRIVVVDIEGQDIGVIVDAVAEVLRIAADSVEPPSPIIKTADSDYLMGIAKIDDRLITLLDLERILSDEERTALKESSVEVH